VKWERFKQIVKMQRKMQNWLMSKEQGGSNRIMFYMSVRNSAGHSISFPPHAINLKTGETFAWDEFGGLTKYNIKEILKENET